MVAVEKKREGELRDLRKLVKQTIREDKKREKDVLGQIRKMRRLPFEEFKAEVCVRLEDIYRTLNVMGNEIYMGYLQDREHMENLLAVLRRAREQDQRFVLVSLEHLKIAIKEDARQGVQS